MNSQMRSMSTDETIEVLRQPNEIKEIRQMASGGLYSVTMTTPDGRTVECVSIILWEVIKA